MYILSHYSDNLIHIARKTYSNAIVECQSKSKQRRSNIDNFMVTETLCSEVEMAYPYKRIFMISNIQKKNWHQFYRIVNLLIS